MFEVARINVEWKLVRTKSAICITLHPTTPPISHSKSNLFYATIVLSEMVLIRALHAYYIARQRRKGSMRPAVPSSYKSGIFFLFQFRVHDVLS